MQFFCFGGCYLVGEGEFVVLLFYGLACFSFVFHFTNACTELSRMRGNTICEGG